MKKIEMGGLLRPIAMAKRTVVYGTLVIVLALATLGAGCSRSSNQKPRDKVTRVDSSMPQKMGNDEAADARKPGETGSPPPQPEEPEAPQLKVVGRRVSLTWQEKGVPKLTATALEVTGNTVSGRAAMKKVNAELYEDGKLVAKLSAPLVTADEKTRVITATGGVTITSTVPESTIRTVRAEWVEWYSREDRIVGNGGVTASGPLARVDAAAFVADTRLRNVTLTADSSEARAVVGR